MSPPLFISTPIPSIFAELTGFLISSVGGNDSRYRVTSGVVIVKSTPSGHDFEHFQDFKCQVAQANLFADERFMIQIDNPTRMIHADHHITHFVRGHGSPFTVHSDFGDAV